MTFVAIKMNRLQKQPTHPAAASRLRDESSCYFGDRPKWQEVKESLGQSLTEWPLFLAPLFAPKGSIFLSPEWSATRGKGFAQKISNITKSCFWMERPVNVRLRKFWFC